MVQMHGGDCRVLDEPGRFPSAGVSQDYLAPMGGTIQLADAGKIGRASLLLGAGRTKTTDVIDHAAGLSNLMKVGESVDKGARLVTLHAATQDRLDAAMVLVREAFVVGPEPVTAGPLVFERL
jgi:thymidine phosphorylase